MIGQQYRIKTPTLAILEQDGQKLPLTIPLHARIRLLDGPLDGNRLVDVEWEGKRVMMFTTDIRERGELVE
jgi:hypothetical protein